MRNVALDQVARVYFGPPDQSGSNQYGNGPYRNNPPPYNQNDNNGNNSQYGNRGQRGYGNSTRTVTCLPTSSGRTRVSGCSGETVHFRASGSITLSRNENDNGTPAGANNGRMAGNSPLPGVTGGMLIGRVNNGQPFAIKGQEVRRNHTVPAAAYSWASTMTMSATTPAISLSRLGADSRQSRVRVGFGRTSWWREHRAMSGFMRRMVCGMAYVGFSQTPGVESGCSVRLQPVAWCAE